MIVDIFGVGIYGFVGNIEYMKVLCSKFFGFSVNGVFEILRFIELFEKNFDSIFGVYLVFIFDMVVVDNVYEFVG